MAASWRYSTIMEVASLVTRLGRGECSGRSHSWICRATTRWVILKLMVGDWHVAIYTGFFFFLSYNLADTFPHHSTEDTMWQLLHTWCSQGWSCKMHAPESPLMAEIIWEWQSDLLVSMLSMELVWVCAHNSFKIYSLSIYCLSPAYPHFCLCISIPQIQPWLWRTLDQ